MKYPAITLNDLYFWIPRDIKSDTDIIKTMVFTNGLIVAYNLVSAIIEQIPKHHNEEELGLVAKDTNSLIAESQSYIIELFQKGICWNLECPKANGIRLDAADIERDIQWSVNSKVNSSTIVKSIRQAARKSHLQAVAIVFLYRTQCYYGEVCYKGSGILIQYWRPRIHVGSRQHNVQWPLYSIC